MRGVSAGMQTSLNAKQLHPEFIQVSVCACIYLQASVSAQSHHLDSPVLTMTVTFRMTGVPPPDLTHTALSWGRGTPNIRGPASTLKR